jgi:hypothetical protein
VNRSKAGWNGIDVTDLREKDNATDITPDKSHVVRACLHSRFNSPFNGYLT